MIDLLLYSTLSCADADAIMLRIKAQEEMPQAVVVELVQTVKESVPECNHYWDAND
jgi:hypothetical protein|tara:strand:+ start:559 stop:726 length:168 start_codon:yes stop_codon:yes gene_type:complete